MYQFIKSPAGDQIRKRQQRKEDIKATIAFVILLALCFIIYCVLAV